MRDPSVLVLTFSAIQLARDLLALLRERAACPRSRRKGGTEIRVVITRKEAR